MRDMAIAALVGFEWMVLSYFFVVNVVYAFFETFGIIHTITKGGPGKSTEILVYKVYADGFEELEEGARIRVVGEEADSSTTTTSPEGGRKTLNRLPSGAH